MTRADAPAGPGHGPRRREHTRARLLAAAEEVFSAQGVRRVTVDDIVSAGGYTRGAFYSNFSSIEEVFFAVFAEQSEALLRIVQDVLEETSAEDFTIALVIERMRPVAGRWSVIQAEFTLMALRSEAAREVLHEHRARFQEQMVTIIGDVLDRLGRRPAIPLDQLTEAAVALYQHALVQEGLGVEVLDVTALAETVLPQLLIGLSEPK